MKKRFLVIHDYGSAGCGWFHYARNREQLEELYASPHKCDEIFEGDEADNHPYVRYLKDTGRKITSYDVDTTEKTYEEEIETGIKTEIE